MSLRPSLGVALHCWLARAAVGLAPDESYLFAVDEIVYWGRHKIKELSRP
jgi:hypothetical protein